MPAPARSRRRARSPGRAASPLPGTPSPPSDFATTFTDIRPAVPAGQHHVLEVVAEVGLAARDREAAGQPVAAVGAAAGAHLEVEVVHEGVAGDRRRRRVGPGERDPHRARRCRRPSRSAGSSGRPRRATVVLVDVLALRVVERGAEVHAAPALVRVRRRRDRGRPCRCRRRRGRSRCSRASPSSSPATAAAGPTRAARTSRAAARPRPTPAARPARCPTRASRRRCRRSAGCRPRRPV